MREPTSAVTAPRLPLPAKLLVFCAVSSAAVVLLRFSLRMSTDTWPSFYGSTFYVIKLIGSAVAVLGGVGLLNHREWGRRLFIVGVCVDMSADAFPNLLRVLGLGDHGFAGMPGLSFCFIIVPAAHAVLVVAYLRDESVRGVTGASRGGLASLAPSGSDAEPMDTTGGVEPPMARPGLPFAAKALAFYAVAIIVFWGMFLALTMRGDSLPFTGPSVGEWVGTVSLVLRGVYLILLAYGAGVFLARERSGRRLLIAAFWLGYAAGVLHAAIAFYSVSMGVGEWRWDFLLGAVVVQLFWTGFLVSYLREERVKRALRY